MRASWLITGLCVGILAGAGGSLALRADLLRTHATAAPTLLRCGNDVDTTGWQSYKSPDFVFQIHYPQTYAARQEGDRVIIAALNPEADNIRTTINLEMLRDTYVRDVSVDEMRLASWKIADRQTYALASSYFTDEDTGSLSELYLFARNFPKEGWSSPTTVVRATVTMSPNHPDLVEAKRLKITDLEEVLTEPERILSTFRFLQRTELPGRDGRVAR